MKKAIKTGLIVSSVVGLGILASVNNPFGGVSKMSAESCNYSGAGDWNVLQTDQCYIVSPVYVNGQFNLIGGAEGSFGCAAGAFVSATRFNFGSQNGRTNFDLKCLKIHQ